MDGAISVVDSYFKVTSDSTHLQEEITQLKRLQAKLIISKNTIVREYEEQGERIRVLEAQL